MSSYFLFEKSAGLEGGLKFTDLAEISVFEF